MNACLGFSTAHQTLLSRDTTCPGEIKHFYGCPPLLASRLSQWTAADLAGFFSVSATAPWVMFSACESNVRCQLVLGSLTFRTFWLADNKPGQGEKFQTSYRESFVWSIRRHLR